MVMFMAVSKMLCPGSERHLPDRDSKDLRRQYHKQRVRSLMGTPRGVLVNDSSLHDKHYPPNGRDVFKGISVQGNDVRLQAGSDRANLIAHAERFRA